MYIYLLYIMYYDYMFDIVMGFLTCSWGELQHWAHGIKATETLDILDGEDIYWGILHSEDLSTDQWWTTISVDICNGHRKREEKDSKINEKSWI